MKYARLFGQFSREPFSQLHPSLISIPEGSLTMWLTLFGSVNSESLYVGNVQYNLRHLRET